MLIKKKFFGIHFKQRQSVDSPAFFLFSTTAKEAAQWSGVQRVSEIEQGTQRVLKATRKRAVQRFFDSDHINTIPSSIILAFLPSTSRYVPLTCQPELQESQSSLSFGYLEFEYDDSITEEHQKPALIVDGQHRLKGMEEVEEELPINLIALIDAPLEEQAFQFIVINKKSVRVNQNDAKAIIADFDDTHLNNRLSKIKINYKNSPQFLFFLNSSEDSPFQNLIDWSGNRAPDPNYPKRFNTMAIEKSIQFIPEKFRLLNEDDDSVIEIFCTLWKEVKNKFPNLFGRNENFMKKISICALTDYLVSGIRSAYSRKLIKDIYDMEQIKEEVRIRLQDIQEDYWNYDWIGVSDKLIYEEMIKRDFESMIDNILDDTDWFQGLEILKSNEMN